MATPLTSRKILATWWPLAASWLFMGTELPMLSAVVARLPEPKIHLAAYGGIVFPLSLIIEAPVIMLLAASTALSKDRASYEKIRRFMLTLGGLLTVLHAAVAFTPLYDFVAGGILNVPAEIFEPGRIGLQIMLPWTWSIAYRRFHQGLLIRNGRSEAVGLGTAVRLSTAAVVLGAGYAAVRWMGMGIPGIVVGSTAIACGVVAEAVYAHFAALKTIREAVLPAPAVEPALTWRTFGAFYFPLALTSLILLIVQPMGSAALARMPAALDSLAVWPVLGGLSFMFRSFGFAYNEVVVALIDQPGGLAALRRFMTWLSAAVTAALLLLAATPLAEFWFHTVSGLPESLSQLARLGLWLSVPWPMLAVLQHWFQGVLVASRRTRVITEAVVVLMVTTSGLLAAGVSAKTWPGLVVGMGAFVAGNLAQVGWLYWRSRETLRGLSGGLGVEGGLGKFEPGEV